MNSPTYPVVTNDLAQMLADVTSSHEAVAARMFQVPESQVTKEQREYVKTLRFHYLYSWPHRSIKQVQNDIQDCNFAKWIEEAGLTITGRRRSDDLHQVSSESFFRQGAASNRMLLEMNFAAIERRVLDWMHSQEDRAGTRHSTTANLEGTVTGRFSSNEQYMWEVQKPKSAIPEWRRTASSVIGNYQAVYDFTQELAASIAAAHYPLKLGRYGSTQKKSVRQQVQNPPFQRSRLYTALFYRLVTIDTGMLM